MIRIIIERFIADSLENNYEAAAKETLQKAVCTPGFISGESLKDTQNSLHRYIVCSWRSVQDWQQWQLSDERKEMMGKLNLMLEKEEKITTLELA